jgi:heme-degrading monooxygenase HmoA
MLRRLTSDVKPGRVEIFARMGDMLIRVWQYDVRADGLARFEAAYRGDGDWAALFGQNRGFVGVDLYASVDTPGRYLTVDRFESSDAWNEFLGRHRAAYDELDARMQELTVDERELLSGEAG